MTPTTNTLYITYELLLCGAVLRYAYLKNPVPIWENPILAFGTLLSVIVRDNFICFFVVTISMAISIVENSGFTGEIGTIATYCHYFLGSLQYAMAGPWIMLSLRRSHEENTNTEVRGSCEITSVAFIDTQGEREAESGA